MKFKVFCGCPAMGHIWRVIVADQTMARMSATLLHVLLSVDLAAGYWLLASGSQQQFHLLSCLCPPVLANQPHLISLANQVIKLTECQMEQIMLQLLVVRMRVLGVRQWGSKKSLN